MTIIPLISELVPEARGAVLAFNLAVIALGHAIGSLLARRLSASSGLAANALLSAGVQCVAILIWWLGVREQPGNTFIFPPDTQ